MATVEHLSESPATPPKNLFELASRLAGMNVALSYMARHDALTGVLNKQAFSDEIGERIAADETFGLLTLDADAFKAVNDSLGHAEGDRVLKDFGAHLTSKFRREGETIFHEAVPGRQGGDEFGVVVNISDRGREDDLTDDERMDRTVVYANSVIDEFVEIQPEAVKDLGFGFSMGAAMRKAGSAETAIHLMKRADKSLYANKTSRRASVI